jgi:hypothetical protein
MYDKWKKKYIHMFRFRSCKNSKDIFVDKSKNLSNIMDIQIRDTQEKTKMGYIKWNATIKL